MQYHICCACKAEEKDAFHGASYHCGVRFSNSNGKIDEILVCRKAQKAKAVEVMESKEKQLNEDNWMTSTMGYKTLFKKTMFCCAKGILMIIPKYFFRLCFNALKRSL